MSQIPDLDPIAQEDSNDDIDRSAPLEYLRPTNPHWRKKDLIERLSAISIKALARGTRDRWLPKAEFALYTKELFASDKRFYMRQFHNLMDEHWESASDLAWDLRFGLLKIKTNEDDYGAITRPTQDEWPLVKFKKKSRSAAFSYYKVSRWNCGVSRARAVAAEKRTSPFAEIPPLYIGKGSEAREDLLALEELAVNEAHPQVLLEIARLSDELDALASKALGDLELTDEEKWLLISDIDDVPNRKLVEFLEEAGIHVVVGYKTLENRRNDLLERVNQWLTENPAPVAAARAALKGLEARCDEAAGKDPYSG